MLDELKTIRGGETGFGILIESDAGYISPTEYGNDRTINKLSDGTESHAGVITGPLVVIVVLQKWGIKNRNGRIYPKNVLEREAQKYQQLIDEKRALGESDHPETSIISIDRVAHNIKRIWWEGKTLLGEMEIIMTRGFKNLGICSTEGDKIANLLLQGYKIGVSSRGVGSLKEIGGDQIVQDDFEIICWDAVTAPSTPGSWISKDIETAKQFVESENKSDKTLLTGLNNFLLG
jgi:hypothetical protein